MFHEKCTQLFSVDQAFSDPEQKGFGVGREGMTVGTVSVGTAGKPAVNDRPIKENKEGTIVLDKRVNIEQGGQSGLIKANRCRYHNKQLLRVSGYGF